MSAAATVRMPAAESPAAETAAAAAPAKKPAKKPRAVALRAPPKVAFDASAAETPYMFIGALAGAEDLGMVEAALIEAVSDVEKVTSDEAVHGWGLSTDLYYALPEPRSARDVSVAAHRHHKGSVKAFRASIGDPAWAAWVDIATKADAAGMKDLVARARAAATHKDTRLTVLRTALYFAGLESDAPGTNAIATTLRDAKLRHPELRLFVEDGPDDVDDMRDAAAVVAASIAAAHTAPAPASGKRKRAAAAPQEDPVAAKKVRRSSLFTAFIDAGLPVPDVSEMTAEETAYLESGPMRASDAIEEAGTIAARRLLSA